MRRAAICVALLLFDFFFELLRGHLQILLVLPVLKAIVEQGQRRQRAANLETRPEKDAEQVRADFGGRLAGKVQQSSALAPERPAGDGDDEEHLQQTKTKMHGIAQREDSLGIGQRVDPLPIEADLLRKIEEAELAHVCQHRAQ